MKTISTISANRTILFSLFGSAVLSATILNGLYHTLLFFIIPAATLFVYWLIHDLRAIYVLMIAVLPFTVEVELPNGLGLDLPTELLMILLTGLGCILLLLNSARIPARYFLHPISVLLILHMSWIGFTTLLSTDPTTSLKYLLAKTWYIVPFYGLPFYFLKKKADILIVIKYLLLSLAIACSYVWFNHAQTGFSFSEINRSGYPIFRNHVNYACLTLISTPFYVLYTIQYKGRWKSLLYLLGLFFIMSIFLSYTRAAMIALVVGFISVYIIKWKLIKPALVIAAIASIFVIHSLLQDNEFILHAPDYNKTISHQKFDDLIDATAKGEDISTMERAYRWVAGYYMIQDKPIAGFGPGTFYSNYKSYAISLFKTYVSGNPERSTIHNYYFLVLVEQGIVGFLIFIGIILYALIRGQSLYHQLVGFEKQLLLAAMVCFIMILTINLINDLIESLKVGAFFFLSLSLIVASDLKYYYYNRKPLKPK